MRPLFQRQNRAELAAGDVALFGCALDPHDLALSKLARNSPIDRDDIAHLAKAVPLDANILRVRYQRELRPIIIGDAEQHDRTLTMWIDAYFR